MTIDLKQQKANLSGNMDFVPDPDFYNLQSDHALPSVEVAAYAASPNSLFMYEQEKFDMQNSLSGLCGNNNCSSIESFTPMDSDFDLNPQFECSSMDLSLMTNLYASSTASSPDSWNPVAVKLEPGLNDMLFKPTTGPTLAELNMEESLLDDSANTESGFTVSKNRTVNDGTSVSSTVSSTASVPPSCVSSTSSSPHFSNLLPSVPKCSSWNVRGTKSSCTKDRYCPSSSTVQSPEYDDKTVLHTLLQLGRPTGLPSTQTQSGSSDPSSSQSLASVGPTNCRMPMATMGQTQPYPQTSVKHTHANARTSVGLSRSAKVSDIDHETVEEKWKEIEKFIHEPVASPSSSTSTTQSKRSRNYSGSSAITSGDDVDSDNDDDGDDAYSEKDSDLDDDISDEESDQFSPLEESLPGSGKKKVKQFFWQYNVQSKGPKGTRLRLALNSSNPHVLSNFEDPVFDPTNTVVAGIRHGGKARKGDGNDIQANPKKLYQIGLQIRRLNRQINEVSMGSEASSTQKNKSRKEKNKLASRACRLKKKAQHEAHKVKLYGLECEHKQLMGVLKSIRSDLRRHVFDPKPKATPEVSLAKTLELYIQKHLNCMTAGNTTEYVNTVIRKVGTGDPTGGLNISKKSK
ncbi:CREB3 regulatory factor-like isoform X2 [Gigantopelta aegis]|nr:CREB3 regulatory factor-like isoform X2 [Gigantopelta aegis]XP_041369127.1 CREB3 regulatory factor-like isoform X2 [Gigantopelta aegis]